MRTPEEYAREYWNINIEETLKPFWELEVKKLSQLINKIQIEAYNEALLDATKNVKLVGSWGDEDISISSLNTRDYNGEWMNFTISNESILKLKK